MERIYNKLVRDNIPNILKSKGETPVTRILSEDEYKNELEKKLYEEYKEVIEASGSDRSEELADMLEIINALAKIESKTLDTVILVAEQKNEKRGAFNEKICVEKVIESNK